MTNLLDSASAWLSEQRKLFMSSSVTYSRGTNTVSVLATIGRTPFGLSRSDGVAVIENVRDYQIEYLDLGLTPRRGDRITEASGEIFEVNAPDVASDVWEFTDSFRRTMKIHARKV